jgi:hypothetical protein
MSNPKSKHQANKFQKQLKTYWNKNIEKIRVAIAK